MMDHKRLSWLKEFGEITFWLAVLCALLFSVSGWQVSWLKEAFSSPGQLVYRAISALVVSVIWLGVMKLIDSRKKSESNTVFDIRKYDRKLLVVTLLCRPFFNLCFILSITTQTATIALMILLFIKMLTNVVLSMNDKATDEKNKPTKYDLIGYAVVTLGIIVYGWDKPGMFDWVLLYAIVSGFLEGLRIELIKKMGVKDEDTPTFSVFEFTGMLIIALVLLVIFVLTANGSLFAVGFVGINAHALFSMITLPITTVSILALDYYLAKRMSTGKYSAILATELGFAGVVNMIFLGSAFGPFQIIGLVISMVAIIIIKLSSKNNKKTDLVEND